MNDFTLQDEGGYGVVALPHRVDLTNTQGLLDAVEGAMERGLRRIYLDLSTTVAIDSTALGAVVSLYKSLRARGGTLALLGVRESIQRVLSLTRLESVLTVFPTREEVEAAERKSS